MLVAALRKALRPLLLIQPCKHVCSPSRLFSLSIVRSDSEVVLSPERRTHGAYLYFKEYAKNNKLSGIDGSMWPRWHALSDSERQKFEALAEEHNRRIDEQPLWKRQFQSLMRKQAEEAKKEKLALSQLDRPTRINGFHLYVMEKFAESGNTGLLVDHSPTWRALSDEEKEEYNRTAQLRNSNLEEREAEYQRQVAKRFPGRFFEVVPQAKKMKEERARLVAKKAVLQKQQNKAEKTTLAVKKKGLGRLSALEKELSVLEMQLKEDRRALKVARLAKARFEKMMDFKGAVEQADSVLREVRDLVSKVEKEKKEKKLANQGEKQE